VKLVGIVAESKGLSSFSARGENKLEWQLGRRSIITRLSEQIEQLGYMLHIFKIRSALRFLHRSNKLEIQPKSYFHSKLRSQQLRRSPRTAVHSHQYRQLRAMSDDAYASFLDKANEDVSKPKSGGAQTRSAAKQKPKTVDEGLKVPSHLEKVDAVYVTDADEDFVPVALKWDGDGLPSDGMYCVFSSVSRRDLWLRKSANWVCRGVWYSN
jgi:hypothetical protein